MVLFLLSEQEDGLKAKTGKSQRHGDHGSLINRPQDLSLTTITLNSLLFMVQATWLLNGRERKLQSYSPHSFTEKILYEHNFISAIFQTYKRIICYPKNILNHINI